ncbi:MAG: dihydroneopterin aldolase [Firmicutes bacterium]|nr:dihydroneopterin aldolase [Bacillota bacterium]
MTTRLRLNNMVFYGYHGIYSAEKELGQRIEVDVELVSDFVNVGKTDDFELSINYVDVYTIVKEIVEESEFNLIEAIGVAVVDQILDSFDIEQVTVRVRKPQPPVGGLLDSAEFEMTKNRDDKLVV